MINIFETSFEARERRFQIEKLYHGETVDLVGVVTTNGVPQNIMGYAVSGVFQPTSMNGSPDFYELSADIVDNKVLVHWEKGKDFGENSYMVWALLTDGDNVSYPLAWRLDMAYSPSYPLSSLDPIPKTIDFDKYDLLNAPWLPLSGGAISGRIYYDIEEPVQITNLSSWIGDATGLGRGIITIYNETQNTLDDKYSQEGATLSGRWDNMWNPPNPTGPLVFPENPQEGDTFDPYAAMDGEYLNGKDVTFSKGTVLIANPGWETKEVPCFKIHVVYSYIYHVGEGWVVKTENDWCICKIDGEWQAASFSNGFTAYDSLVWHEFSEGGTEPKEPDPFVLSSELGNFATKKYVQEAIASIPTPEVGDFATYEYVNGKFETQEDARIAHLQLMAEIDKKIDKDEVSAVLSNYATESFVNDSFNNARTYTDEQIDWLSNVYTKTDVLTATYETKQHAADTYHTKADAVADSTYLNGRIDGVETDLSTNYATKTYVQEYVDEHGGASGDYLPLSGGNLSGRIYLKTTETRIVGSTCVFTYQETESPYFGTIDSNVDVHFFVSLSVENAGQEFIDMLASGEWTGEGTDYTVKAYVEVTEDWYSTTKSTTVTGTVNFGDSHSSGAIDVYLDFPEYAEDESNLTINQIVFEDNADPSPVIDITFDVEGNSNESTEEYLNDPSEWTVETVSEEVTVNEPFVTSADVDAVIGDINSILDSINGQTI